MKNFKNLELSVDVTTYLNQSKRMLEGVPYSGYLTRMDDQRMVFAETTTRLTHYSSGKTEKLYPQGKWLTLSRSLSTGQFHVGCRNLPCFVEDKVQLLSEMVNDLNCIIHLLEKEA